MRLLLNWPSSSTKTILMDCSCARTSSISERGRSLNGHAWENTLNAVSWSILPDMVMAMSWFATTERGQGRPSLDSNSLDSHLRAMTMASAISSGAVARTLARIFSPTRCPALPALWIIRETCLAELYWMTMSVDPTSIPSSRDDVQMSAFSSPDLKRSSISILVSLDREP